uniref:acetyl-CoA carboxytransferase subunit beta n=1 Tax=Cuscuta epithymum TaxID=186058 RepID=UPI0022FD78BB|nr:acetyl-CoA carboxytransferase subunit beta [Cuscuta epithymum]WBF90905.1 acetyl-CoA carboxytransferase subunit beta [Cuscuta epithymum]
MEECGDYLQLSSSDRIDFLIDEKTWVPIDEEILSGDPIQFDIPFDEDSSKQMISECLLQCGIILDKIKEDSSKEMISECLIQCGILLKEDSSKERISEDPIPFDIPLKEVKEDSSEEILSENPIPFNIPWKENSYEENLDFYQIKTGLTEAVQTGLGQINGITVAIGVMDFKFMGGSMGSVVGEKITRLIEYATKNFLPLIIVSASGGARMQEGSLSLMQMAKISSALYNYQSNKRLFYISILTSPTTGGITASFGMLGDIIIVEPNAYIAFAGKRVIEETLKQTIPDEAQEAEFLFEKGSFDLIVPRHLLKSVISELFTFHDRGTFFHSEFK